MHINLRILLISFAFDTTLSEAWIMVYRRKAVQLSIESFGSGLSTPLSPDNEWLQLADQVPWPQLEEAYQLSFPSNLGRAGKPFRLLYGAQLIKQRTQLSDRELVAAIRDTPAYQYFIVLPEYQPQAPFSFSALSYSGTGSCHFPS